MANYYHKDHHLHSRIPLTYIHTRRPYRFELLPKPVNLHFKCRPGLTQWVKSPSQPADPSGGRDAVPWMPTMNPPQSDGDGRALGLDRCMRILPHVSE